MLRLLLTLFAFLFFCDYSLAQDSTEVPETIPKNLRPGTRFSMEWIGVNDVRYFPAFLQHAIDSVNHGKVVFKMWGDSSCQDGIKKRVDREFRSIRTNKKDIWLLTYAHLNPNSHIHFVIFITDKKRVLKMTAGISEYSIDSIETIQRFKKSHAIKFINLQSKIDKHKF